MGSPLTASIASLSLPCTCIFCGLHNYGSTWAVAIFRLEASSARDVGIVPGCWQPRFDSFGPPWLSTKHKLNSAVVPPTCTGRPEPSRLSSVQSQWETPIPDRLHGVNRLLISSHQFRIQSATLPPIYLQYRHPRSTQSFSGDSVTYCSTFFLHSFIYRDAGPKMSRTSAA